MIIGVIGYSDDKCRTELAAGYVAKAILEAARQLGCQNRQQLADMAICSGLTDLGIPALAYRFAKQHGMFTIGVACKKATEYACYPVHNRIIEGENWGDESATFLSTLDALVRIGGGPQSEREAAQWQKDNQGPYIYYPLTRDGLSPETQSN